MDEEDLMKEKIIKKYFRYNDLYYNIKSELVTKGMYFVDRELINTQERKYFINGESVTETEFFKNIPDSRYYFENHTYMSKGLSVYIKHYRNTLSLHDAVKRYKKTLDNIDQFILRDVPDEWFCHCDYEGNRIIPNMEWVK